MPVDPEQTLVSLLRARITGTAVSGGINYYAWEQVIPDYDDGTENALDGGRYGSTTSSPATEINNTAGVANGTIVHLRQKGLVDGQMHYEFSCPAAGSGISGTGTDNRVVRWDGTTAVQDSLGSLDDSGNLAVGTVAVGIGPPGGSNFVFRPMFASTCGVGDLTGVMTLPTAFMAWSGATVNFAVGGGAYIYTFLNVGTNIQAAGSITATSGISGSTVNGITLTGSSTPALTVTGTSALTGFTGSGTSSGTNTGDQTSVTGSSGSCTGNAATATALQTGRAINGTTFDGTAAITVTAAAGTLTGTTLNSSVVTSSLTSVGTLTGGATGAGFTVALSTSTITGTLPAANIGAATVALSKIANASASSKLLGSGASGSGASYSEITLGTGLSMSGTTLNGGAGTVTSVGLTAPAAGITVAGSPVTTSGSFTLALADDLAALEALSGTNTIYYRSAASTWTAVTIGSGVAFSGGTLSATGSGGTVTSVSVTTANGVSGSVATSTTTPAITLTLGAITPSSVAATGAGSFTPDDANNTGITTALTLTHTTSGTAADNIGVAVDYTVETASGATSAAARDEITWATAAAATRKGRRVFVVYDVSTAREALAMGVNGSAATIGFLGATVAARQTGDVGTAAVTFGLMSGTPTFASANLTGTTTNQEIILEDQKSSGTAGGAATATTWHTRTLNTEVRDTGSNCSLASNQFTLGAGTYRIRASAPCLAVDITRLRLQNITDTATTLWGQSSYAYSTNVAGISPTLEGTFTIASSKTFELQHYAQTARATNGLGVASSLGTEIYARVILEKEAT